MDGLAGRARARDDIIQRAAAFTYVQDTGSKRIRQILEEVEVFAQDAQARLDARPDGPRYRVHVTAVDGNDRLDERSLPVFVQEEAGTPEILAFRRRPIRPR